MIEKLRTHSIGVVGVGKLGLPLAVVLADAGHEVVAVDKNADRIAALKADGYTGPEPDVEKLLKRNQEKIQFSNDFNTLENSDIVYVIVPTPSDDNGLFINTYLLSALSDVGRIWKGGNKRHTLVVVSTVIPGSCENSLIPHFEKELNEKLGPRINLLYSPEFIALGTVVFNLKNPDLTLIGAVDENAAELHLEIMNTIVESKPETQVLKLTEAELSKLLINTYVTMKISFANFIFEITDKIGGNAELVAKSIGMDSRIGFKYLKPGLGFAGPCFPRDNKALIAIANSQKLIANLAIATDEINSRQPQAMFKRISANLNKKSHILIIGITYKYGSEVVEESQGIKLAHEFANAGFQVTAIDSNLNESPKELSKDVRFLNKEEDFSQYDFIINANGSPFEIKGKINSEKYVKY